MMEQVRLCAVNPLENWLGSSLNQMQGWTSFRESYSPALEQVHLLAPPPIPPPLFSIPSGRLCDQAVAVVEHEHIRNALRDPAVQTKSKDFITNYITGKNIPARFR